MALLLSGINDQVSHEMAYFLHKKAAIKAAKPEEQQRFLKAVASQGM